MSYGSFIFFMAVLAVSICCWNSADLRLRSLMMRAILPKMLALIMAPIVIELATNAI